MSHTLGCVIKRNLEVMQASCNEDAPAMYNVLACVNSLLSLVYAVLNLDLHGMGLSVIGLLFYGTALLSSGGV